MPKCSGPMGQRSATAALVMLDQVPGTEAVTVDGDRVFDTRDFVKECRHMGVVQRRTRRRPVAAPLMATPHGTLGTPSARKRGSGSKNALAG
jgi:hypothetical protein